MLQPLLLLCWWLQELPGCHFLPPAAAFSRSSIEHSAVVQQTEPGINVAHTDQLSTATVSALSSALWSGGITRKDALVQWRVCNVQWSSDFVVE